MHNSNIYQSWLKFTWRTTLMFRFYYVGNMHCTIKMYVVDGWKFIDTVKPQL